MDSFVKFFNGQTLMGMKQVVLPKINVPPNDMERRFRLASDQMRHTSPTSLLHVTHCLLS